MNVDKLDLHLASLERHTASLRDGGGASDAAVASARLAEALEELRAARRELVEEREELTAARDAQDVATRERKIAEDQLAFQASLLNAIDQAAIATDAEGTIIYWNRCAEKLYGWTAEEAIGRPIVELLLPDGQEVGAAAVMAELRGGQSGDGELLLRRRDGSLFVADVTGSPVRDDGGRVIAIVGVSRDVTAHRREQDEVSRQRDQLQLIIDSLPVLISYVDRECRYRFMNKSYEEWFGQGRGELLGLHLSEVLGIERFEVIRPRIEATLRGAVMQHETVALHKDGSTRPVAVTYVPDRREDGRIDGFFALVEDVSERKQKESANALLSDIALALNESLDYEETLRRVVNAAVPAFADYCSIYTLEPDGLISRRFAGAVGVEIEVETFPLPRESPVRAALRQRKPVLLEHVDDSFFRTLGVSADHFDAFIKAQVHSGIVVPIVTGGEVRAALVFGMSRSERSYGTEDVEQAEEIARRAGMAIDNARLYREAQIALDELGRALAEKDEALSELDTVLSASPAGIALWDRELRYVRVNDALARLNGLSAAEHVGKTTKDVHPRFWPEAEPILRKALAGEATVNLELRLPSPSGKHRHWLRSYYPVRRADGEILGVALTVHEITDLKKAEEALRDNERVLGHRLEELEALLDVVPVGIGIADGPEARTIRTNLELSRVLRAPPHANASPTAPADERLPFRAFRHGAEVPAEELPMQMAAATGQPVRHSEIDIVHEDGTVINLYGGAIPLFDEQGNVRGSIGAFLDVTELRRIEQDLRRANAAKDEFLGLVSHELKTPITTILGNAEILQKRAALLDEESRAAALADIHDEAGKLHGIIDNLLVLARLDRGQEFELEPLRLHRLVESVLHDHRRRYPHREIVSRVGRDLPMVIAVDVHIEQVLRNLLSNAEKYSPPTMPIEIDAMRSGDEIELRVLDRGVGLPLDEVESVFTAFYRSPRTASHAQGFGIGLAVCRRLIEAQGGRIWAAPRPDGGAEFGFALPVVPEEPWD
jgi:PAS domain S-box-containing protein